MGSDRVREAMAAVPRALFLPADQQPDAGEDVPLPIGHGATCSQPTTVAHMLGALAPRPGDRALDVGSGSGWTTALLAHLVAPSGTVVGVELEPQLARTGSANLLRARVEGAQIHATPHGRLGWPEQAPFDRILVSAEAAELPHELVEQLGEGGRMVIPVAGRLLVVDRDGEGTRTTVLGHYRFVPLRLSPRSAGDRRGACLP